MYGSILIAVTFNPAVLRSNPVLEASDWQDVGSGRDSNG